MTSARIFLDLTEQTGLTEQERKIDSLLASRSPTLLFSVRRNVQIANEPYEAAKDSHALVICTEWEEFAVSVKRLD